MCIRLYCVFTFFHFSPISYIMGILHIEVSHKNVCHYVHFACTLKYNFIKKNLHISNVLLKSLIFIHRFGHPHMLVFNNQVFKLVEIKE